MFEFFALGFNFVFGFDKRALKILWEICIYIQKNIESFVSLLYLSLPTVAIECFERTFLDIEHSRMERALNIEHANRADDFWDLRMSKQNELIFVNDEYSVLSNWLTFRSDGSQSKVKK